jgi:hypothetical protein
MRNQCDALSVEVFAQIGFCKQAIDAEFHG